MATTTDTVHPDALGDLRDSVDAMADGRAPQQVLLLTGAPGAGKSTALDRVGRMLGERGVRVYRVVADEIGRRRPFGLMSTLLGLEEHYPPLAETPDLVLEAVEKRCADGPVALCADDVHHADADSLALLGRLAGTVRDLPLSLVLARRALPVRESLDALAARPDVRTLEIAGLGPGGLDELVRERLGAPPGARLRELLAVTGGNPFHAGVLLDDLRRQDRLAVVDGETVVRGDGRDVPTSVQASVRAHLALLEAPARDLLRLLAVWGRPSTVEQLAAVGGTSALALVGAVEAAVSAGIAGWNADDELAFRHDLFRDVIYADLAPPLRRLLHEACASRLRATGGIATQILQHDTDAAEPIPPAEALRIAASDLAHAPAQAADVLAGAAQRCGDGPEADAIALARAGALAAAGQIAEAERVARERLHADGDRAARYDLTRVALHAMVSSAHVGAALATIDDYLAGDPPESERTTLRHLRRWVEVLEGRGPVVRTMPSGPRSGAALVPAAMDLFLAGRCESALELAVEARDAREAGGSPPWADGATAPIWPAWFALYARGPEAARAESVEARRRAQERGQGWLGPLHLFVAGEIDRVAGRWDDTLAELDTGLEAAALTGSGWLSRATAGVLQTRIRRGELDGLETAQERWRLRGLPEQFGLPMTALTTILLAEARGRQSEVVDLARTSWTTTLDGGRLLWALLAGPDIARLALDVGDAALLRQVATDTAAVPVDEAVALAPAVDLVAAVADADPDLAAAAAAAFDHRGHAAGALSAWEEAAVAAATRGDGDRARTHARRCTELAASLGAAGTVRRLTARLRAHDVRLGVSGSRRRPATGWQSLTPTERQVAELVGKGLTSPQIGSQLFISPRTVQTHISHSLRKLDLRSRVELATTVARHTS
ncbi:LuxR C-terminal-related transcriptional regulator [Actinomycetospora endophytica]|uniref:LuxR C-terminal-related transcriptional regulator n=1 Tax=Actinomycetospora endophytica TaxID=2291215 RepID=A0ABS8PEW6_9PSEU|nr:LuxR family transcriptional regulator [Actinomycetospora endophytica]MCD2196773.1 LuxR C-terminal-related transcriptional regulator [Actinomycetospora endophytica]